MATHKTPMRDGISKKAWTRPTVRVASVKEVTQTGRFGGADRNLNS